MDFFTLQSCFPGHDLGASRLRNPGFDFLGSKRKQGVMRGTSPAIRLDDETSTKKPVKG